MGDELATRRAMLHKVVDSLDVDELVAIGRLLRARSIHADINTKDAERDALSKEVERQADALNTFVATGKCQLDDDDSGRG